MKLSENFTLAELTATSTGISNSPMPAELDNLKTLTTKLLQPLRELYGKSIRVNSGYRNPVVNRKVGGAKTSHHMQGTCADITGGSKEENKKLYNLIKENLEFRQLINEYDYSWVHVEYKKGDNKKQEVVIK